MLMLYQARYVYPVTRAPIEHGAVVIDEGRILAVGAATMLHARYPGARVVDLGDALLLPAAVNAHTHLQLTHMAGHIPEGLPFAEWIVRLTRARREADLSRDAEAVATGVTQLRASGTAALGDITTNGGCIGPIIESGLRGTVYYELLSGDPARAPELLRRGQEQLALWRAEYAGAAVRFGLSLHSPYTVSAPLFRLVAEWCAAEDVPLCIHAAESPPEVQWLRDRSGPIAETLYGGLGLPTNLEAAPGCSPMTYLDRLGVLRQRPLLAHGVQVDAADLALLARSGVPVVHCPRSNARLLVGRMPYAAYRAAGVPLALGTDSLASSPSLSIWHEAAFAAALHSAAGEPPTPADLLRLATLDGAAALGLADELGSLDVGKSAELAYAALEREAEPFPDTAEAALAALFAGAMVTRRAHA